MFQPLFSCTRRSLSASVLVSAVVAVLLCESASALVITELHYHPAGSGAASQRSEFVEVYNENPGPLDLSGFFFSDGVSFTFSDGTLLPGRSYLVIAGDVDFVSAVYGIGNVLGNWSSGTSLDNGGESLSIANRSGVLVASVRYNDRNQWPAGADGTGHTLALIDVFRDNEDPDNWALSEQFDGTPGRANFSLGSSGGGPMDANGFILDWLVLGPYEGSNCVPPGIGGDWLTEGIGGVDQSHLEWRAGQVVRTNYGIALSTGLHPNAANLEPTVTAYRSPQDTINFNDQVYPPDPNDVMAYAMTYVHNLTETPMAVAIAMASDDSMNVLMNGQSAFSRGVCRGDDGAGAIQDRQNVTLQPGRNLVMVKVFEGNGGWAFRLRFEERGTQQPLLPADEIAVTLDPAEQFAGSQQLGGLRINEALILTNGPRWVELFNGGSASADLSGFHLTDSRESLTRATIPDGTEILAGGVWAVESATLGLDFTPDESGRVFVALVLPDGQCVVDAYSFEPTVLERSEARFPDGDDRVEPAANPTQGTPNSVSVIDSIVVNEVQYHPMVGEDDREFVEVHHRGMPGEASVDLSGWQFTDGLRFEFPAGTMMEPGDYLVVARQPELIRDLHALDATQVIGPAIDPLSLESFGVLRNSGERLRLVNEDGNTIDTLRYFDGGEWPLWADGRGSSLELVDVAQDNASPQAWDASDESGKVATAEFSYTSQHVGGEPELQLALTGSGIVLVDDLFLGPAGSFPTTETVLVELGELWRYFKGMTAPPENWMQPEFDPTTWLSGATGIGYEDGDDATVLTDMQFNYISVFCRREFTLNDLTDLHNLTLEIDYDDGYVAYLNGFEISRAGLVGNPPGHLVAASSREAGTLVTVDVSGHLHRLVEGTNVLAIQVHNTMVDSSDLSLRPRLVVRQITGAPTSGNLLSNGSFDSSDNSWVIEGNHIHSGRTDEDPISGAGSLKLIATGRGDNKVNRLETEIGGLVGGGSYDVYFRARWVTGASTLLTRGYDHGLAHSHALATPDNFGTPGRPNSVTLRREIDEGNTNLGPVIDHVSQNPVLPQSNQPVVIRARIDDPDGVEFPTVRWTTSNTSNLKTTVGMVGPDADGFFEAQISGYSLGTRVLFEITARDESGNLGRYPVDVRERSHPLVVNAGAVSGLDLRWAIYGHATPVSTAYLGYHFFMSSTHETELNGRRLHSNEYVDGTLVFQDQIYYQSEFRFSGSPWLRVPWNSLRIRLPKDRPLHDRIGKMNLDVHGLDARERISHYLIGQLGGTTRVPHLRQVFTRIQVNSRLNAVREQIEVPDGDFLSSWFPGDSDGNLFEVDDRFEFNDEGLRVTNRDGRWLHPPYGSGGGDDKEEYRYYFGLRANEEDDDFSDLISTARVLSPSRTSDSEFDALIWDHINVDEFLRVWAIRMNTDDWDTWGTARGKNAYLYRTPGEGLWYLFPWDLELTYGNLETFSLPADPSQTFANNFPEVERLINRPCIKRRYYGILKEMIDGPFSSSHLDPYLDALEAIGAGSTNIGRLNQFIDTRAQSIRQWIDPAVFPQVGLEILDNGGNSFVTETSPVSLQGTAPADVLFIRVLRNGVEIDFGSDADFCSGDFFGWTLDEIPLVGGDNDLDVLGLDSAGNLVDSASVRVTYLTADVFLRGDGDGDSIVDIADPMLVLFFAFVGNVVVRCEDSLDADDSGVIDGTDAVVLLTYLFLSGTPPAQPFPAPGSDPTVDGLEGCDGAP